jgi:hypothetical protein
MITPNGCVAPPCRPAVPDAGRAGLSQLRRKLSFLRAEIVHSSERTRITRLFLPKGTVIRKEPLGPEAERRVRHEASMLERLRGVAGVAQLAEAPRYPGSVVLEDAGGASLAGVTGPLAAGELASLGHVDDARRDLTPDSAGRHGSSGG